MSAKRDVRTNPVWAIAHRGASADCPENTLAAFDEALRCGCDGIELDVQMSGDGTPVVYHDRTLARAGQGRFGVADLRLDELRGLDVGAWLDSRFRGQHIPTLEEVLERYGKRTRLLIEIKRCEGRALRDKHQALARAVVGLVEKLKVGPNVMILSFETNVLEACAALAPELRRVLNLKPPPWLRRPLRERLATLFALSVDVRTLTPAFASAVREAGRPLLVYTCNTERRVGHALRCGAAGVMSDRPGWLADTLKTRG